MMLVILISIMIILPRWTGSATMQFNSQWCSFNDAFFYNSVEIMQTYLSSAVDFALDSVNNLYMADTARSCIELGLLPGNQITVSTVNAHQSINLPFWISVDANQSVYIGDHDDQGLTRIQFWPSFRIPFEKVILTGLPANCRICLGTDLTIFVATWNLIMKYSPPYYNESIFFINLTNTSDLAFGMPSNIYVDAGNSIYVIDINKKRVIKWAWGSNDGAQVVAGTHGELVMPQAVTIDCLKNMYISDLGTRSVIKYFSPKPTTLLSKNYFTMVSDVSAISIGTDEGQNIYVLTPQSEIRRYSAMDHMNRLYSIVTRITWCSSNGSAIAPVTDSTVTTPQIPIIESENNDANLTTMIIVDIISPLVCSLALLVIVTFFYCRYRRGKQELKLLMTRQSLTATEVPPPPYDAAASSTTTV